MTLAGIFSVQKVLPSEPTSWEVDYEIGETMYRIKGNAIYGRPHGADSDVLLALQTLFFRAGCPVGDRIEVLPADILRMAQMDNGGKAYARLREALLRLSGVKWSMVRSRWDEKRQRHAGGTTVVGLISELRLVDSGGARQPFVDRQLDERMPIEVIFSPTFADSIRAGLYQMLDAELLSRLKQAPARSLYRVIQAHRVRPDGSLAGELHVPFRDWARACGVEEGRADNAKRVLLLAHERLEQEGYLKAAEFNGRGFGGSVTYQFLSKPQPELAELLIARGITRPVAESLSADYPERVEPALRLVEAKLESGWKPRSLSASVVDAVREPGKWGYAAPERPKKTLVKRKSVKIPDEPVSDPKATSLALIRVKLGRPLSPLAELAVDELSPEHLALLNDAALRPRAEALPLIQALLNAPL